MTQEEKARAYDEAVINCSRLWECGEITRENYEYIFPELKESEDERIRENIIATIHLYYGEPLEDEAEEMIAWLESQGEQKPADTEKGAKGNDREIPISAWSEEDEARFESCIKVLQTSDGYDTINAKWLKSLKDRVQPLQQEWSEKDERMFKNTIALIETLEDYNKAPNGFGDVKFWLKSLKERYTWKPSDEQMHYLSWIANVKLGDSVVEQEVSKHLNELLEDLKKLREE